MDMTKQELEQAIREKEKEIRIAKSEIKNYAEDKELQERFNTLLQELANLKKQKGSL